MISSSTHPSIYLCTTTSEMNIENNYKLIYILTILWSTMVLIPDKCILCFISLLYTFRKIVRFSKTQHIGTVINRLLNVPFVYSKQYMNNTISKACIWYLCVLRHSGTLIEYYTITDSTKISSTPWRKHWFQKWRQTLAK